MEDKRGQGLSTNTIILIILGVVVLVVLIVGFTVGWSSLFPYVSNNINQIASSCETACVAGSVYDYCTANRTLQAKELTGGELIGNCKSFETNPGTGFGFKPCSSIPTCP